MSTHASTSTPEQLAAEVRVAHLDDACAEAAYRLTVAIGVINLAKDSPLDGSEGDDGGYALTVATELLESIRGDLRTARTRGAR